MDILPQKTILGTLELLEVYEYYDKPCLFSCRNLSSQLFLSIWIDETKTEDVWLYVPVSHKRLEYILNGGIDLRTAFLRAEDNFVFEVRTYLIPKKTPHVNQIFCSRLTDEQLPCPDEYLDCGIQILKELLEKKDAKRMALQVSREAINLVFEFPTLHKMEAPAAKLGMILQSFQFLIDALGQFKNGNPTTHGSIPKNMLEQTQLVVSGTFSGSFGIELLATYAPDLWGNSLALEAIEEFVQLIDAGCNIQKLRNLLFELRPRVASRYRIFLEYLVSSEAALKVDWGSVSSEKGGLTFISLSNAKSALAIVSQVEAEQPKQYQILGELIGLNKRTKSFEILELKVRKKISELQEGKKISGVMTSEVIKHNKQPTIGEIYNATIREITQVSLTTGQEKVEYQLIELQSLKTGV
jgi:hypothetical protein